MIVMLHETAPSPLGGMSRGSMRCSQEERFGTGVSLVLCSRKLAVLATAFAVAILWQSAAGYAAEQRCGWYINPTPGNLWLQDKDALWWITSQREYQGPDAIGADDKAPRMDGREYVDKGNGHGHGCACLTVDTDGKEKITRVYSGHTLPLARCKADKSLPPPAG